MAVHFEDGPFGLFNVDVYDQIRRPSYDPEGYTQKPYVVYSCKWQGYEPDPKDPEANIPKRWAKDGRLIWVQGDSFDADGVLMCPKEKRDGDDSLRVADALWDPAMPGSNLKKAKQFLLDLANASHS